MNLKCVHFGNYFKYSLYLLAALLKDIISDFHIQITDQTKALFDHVSKHFAVCRQNVPPQFSKLSLCLKMCSNTVFPV